MTAPARAKVLPLPTKTRKSAAGEMLLGKYWALPLEHAQRLRAIAEQALANPSALTAWSDAHVPETFLSTERDGIATLSINGPMCRVWDFWARVFGCVPYEIIARDIVKLRNDAAIRAVILQLDTPGGEVAGCGELGALIRSVRDVKPIVAHAAGFTCSAGYWLASQARNVYADPSAVIGSIGTCATFVDFSGMYEELGIEVIDLVSTQSPRKNSDPSTPEGRADWIAILDSLAAVFIADVAKGRGVDEATVLSDYGQGGVFVGQEAITAGLADALGTHDSVHAALLEELERASTPNAFSATEILMAKTTTAPRAKTPKPGASPKPSADPTRRTRAESEPAAEEDEDEETAAGAETEEEDEDEEEEEQEEAQAQAITLPAGMSAQQQAEAMDALVPDATARLRAEGATAERERILGIYGLSAKRGATPKAMKMIVEGMKDPNATKATVSVAMIEGGVMAGASVLAGRQADEEDLDAPSNADGSMGATSDEDLAVRSILSAGKPPKKATK